MTSTKDPSAPKDSEVLFEQLRGHLERGDVNGVVAFFAGMPEKDRRALVRPLRAHTRVISTWGASPETDWQKFWARGDRQGAAIFVAGVASVSGAVTVAKWMRSRQFQTGRQQGFPTKAILQVLAERDPDWLPELADAVSEHLTRIDGDVWRLVDALAELGGVTPTPAAKYVQSWASHHQSGWRTPGQLTAGLRADPRLADFVPLLFDDEGGDEFFSRWGTFAVSVTDIAREGGLDRRLLLDASLRRLLRGGRAGAMQDHLKFWGLLEATDVEIAERISSCISLLSSAHGFVAKDFLATVKRASDAGLLDVELALEAATVAVSRSDKGIVRTALGWLDALATAHPDRIGEIAAATAIGFGGQGADIQGRAIKMIVKRAGVLSVDDRARLVAEGRALLAPDLAAGLATALGEAEAVPEKASFPDIAPYVPRPLPRPIGSPAELAEEYAALMSGDPDDGMVLERVLVAFVSFAAADPVGLAQAVAPIVEHDEPVGSWDDRGDLTPRLALFRLAQAVSGVGRPAVRKRVTVAEIWALVQRRGDRWDGGDYWSTVSPANLIGLRIGEIAAAIGGPGMPPILVSQPTEASGLLDPKVLAERLRRAEAEGWEPLAADFEQALLRLPVDCEGVDASGLTSESGRRFATWCAGDRSEFPTLRRVTARPRRETSDVGHILVARSGFRVPNRPASLFDLIPHAWGEAQDVRDGSDWWSCWPAILPSRPDVVAASLVTADRDVWGPGGDSSATVVLLAECEDGSEGQPFDGLHFLIAKRFLDPDAPFRAGAVDGALVLASRGLLDGARLGADLAAAIRASDTAGLRRAVPCLRDLANGGAARQAWDAISALLTGVLPPAVSRTLSGTGDLLALATELADALAVRGSVAEVSTLAARKGGGAVAGAARRLAAVLA